MIGKNVCLLYTSSIASINEKLDKNKEELKEEINEKFDQNREETNKSVSYTHLDVYKRQS